MLPIGLLTEHGRQVKQYFADLHIHVGYSSNGQPVKISAARNLTVENILKECNARKGINIAGIVDCASPLVYRDIDKLINNSILVPQKNGGLMYEQNLCLLLGTEIETVEDNGRCGHSISFFSDIETLKKFSLVMKKYIKNINLSSQRAHLKAAQFFDIVKSFGGEFVPAHIFSPHKSYYGNCTDRLHKLFGTDRMNRIHAIELGLSADSDMADTITELADKTFLSNSDAHSLSKIAREYNIIQLKQLNFTEFVMALKRIEERKVVCNYGIDPELGKYHRTYCINCGWKNEFDKQIIFCKKCGETKKVVVGVYDRIQNIKDVEQTIHPEHRPKYIKQIPLEFIPGVGKSKVDKLIHEFGNEMNVLHKVSTEDIARVVGELTAKYIALARAGRLEFEKGAGGVYGKIKTAL